MSPVPSLRDRFRLLFTQHPRSSRVRVHTTPQRFHHDATLILGLGCSTCSIRPSRGAPNAAVLLFSRGYRYSLVLRSITSPRPHGRKTHLVLATQGWGPALGCVSGRLAPPFLVGLATSIQHPVYLHAGICLSCLILAHYSCRSRSPVCSKARDATPDFDYAPLYDLLLSQQALPTFAESFWDSVAYFVDLLRFSEYRHTLRLFTVKAATGGAC